MATRATEEEVLSIMDTELLKEDVTPHLRTASMMVTKLLTNEGYSDDELSIIEMWLAAHYVAIRDPMISQEKTGEGTTTFHGKSGMGLDHTPYGQQVKVLDVTGKLAQADSPKKRPAKIEVMLDAS